MHGLSTVELARARPVLRQINLILLVFLAGILAARALPAAEAASASPFL